MVQKEEPAGSDQVAPEGAGGGQTSEEDRRPTPVRLAMDAGDDDQPDQADAARVIRDSEGVDWTVSVSGRSAGGVLPLRTVPLMELIFSRADNPERPLRQALCYGNDLPDLLDQELQELLSSSDPYQEPMQPREEKDRRKKKGKNRRPPRD